MSDSPLRQAQRRQQAAAAQGFDWRDMAGLWAKLAEETEELRAARNASERHEELGDLLFMVVNLARHLGIDADAALRDALVKFDRRYAHVIAEMDALPPPGDPARLDAMEARWQDAKRREREG